MSSVRLAAVVGMLSSYMLVLVLIVFLALASIHRLPGRGWAAFLLLLAAILVAGLLAMVRAATRRERSNGVVEGARESPGLLAAYALLPLLVALAVLHAWLAWSGRDPTGAGGAAAAGYRYGAVVDAGSSGSRLAVFQWRIGDDGNPDVRQIAALADGGAGRPKCPLADIDKPPASGDKAGAGVEGPDTCGCLLDLARRARRAAIDALGGRDLPAMPLWLKATAGVRRQGATEQGRVVEAAGICLSKAPDYEWKGAEVITGAEEGTYAWLAVNALAGTLRSEPAATFGIVEVGGQSAQLAFRVSSRIVPRRGAVITVPLASGPVHVYAISDWLGENAAKDERRKGAVTRAVDECALDGDVGRCLGWINEFLCPEAASGHAARPCPERMPELFAPPAMRFAGLSNFQDIFGNVGLASGTLEDVRRRAHGICGSTGDARARDEATKDAGAYKKDVCFDALYLTQVAEYGWGVRPDAIEPPARRAAAGADWPLGAMLFEATRRSGSGR